MPKFRYTGDAPCYHGGARVSKGDIIDLSHTPTSRWFEKIEPEPVVEEKPVSKKKAGGSE